MGSGGLRVVMFAGLVLLPIFMAVLMKPAGGNFFTQLGRHCALLAFMLLLFQPVTAARIKWIERPFGFDILIRYHKHMALFAGLLLLIHPLLIAAGNGGWHLLIGLDLPWYIWIGKGALALVLLNIGLSVFQRTFQIRFEKWRVSHDLLAPLLITMGFVHSWTTGADMRSTHIRILWATVFGVAICIYIYHIIVRPQLLKRRSYRVVSVRPETENVWTVKLQPPAGTRLDDFYPGQFHFVKFFRGRGLPVEEHHWTISSPPSQKDYVSSTIKALGDFTATIGRTKAGDTAAVHGAFGRFSYLLHPLERELVFIAGGIGITPFMSMLRHMQDVRDSRSVRLLYANDKENRIVFHKALTDIASSGYPRLKIIHVLRQPPAGWNGESGLLDQEKIERLCGSHVRHGVFYICGPAPMREVAVASLKNLGVPDRRIRIEIFSFLD